MDKTNNNGHGFISNPLESLNEITRTLASNFLDTRNLDDGVNAVLDEILVQSNVGRAYIFQYESERREYNCPYEVTAPNASKQKDNLQSISETDVPWWHDCLCHNKPIILNKLSDLPPEASKEYSMLSEQNIKSMMVIPIISNGALFGCLGVDIVDKEYEWTKIDYEGLSLLSNVIGVCMKLYESEQRANKTLNELYEREVVFHKIANSAKVGYMIWNYKTSQAYAIKQWYENWDEPENKSINEIVSSYEHVHPDDREGLFEQVKRLLEDSKNIDDYVVRVEDGNGGWKWIRIHSTISTDEYGNKEILGMNFDITPIKEQELMLIDAKEKAETMDKLKSAFLANMSHEIRTPLNSIVGFSNLLVEDEEGLDKESKDEYKSIINNNSNLLLELIGDILDLSKIEAGTIEIVNGPVEINSMLRDIGTIFSEKMKEGVQFINEIPSEECKIYGDRNRIVQIITNFITNATKFTKEGYIKLSCNHIGEEIEFDVEDTGMGIPPDKLDDVFNSFVKLNSFIQGTGLGLAICKSLVTSMNGEIGVRSELGKGSTFWFRIPCLPIPAENEVDNLGKSETSKIDHTPLILVAEDNDSNYLLISTMLKSYQLVRASNGQNAVDLFKQRHPDIILMDMKMPVMSGFEATREIRKIDKHIPIFGVTALAFDSDKTKVIDAGCNEYISKPIKAAELKDKISQYLR
jgi:signal transduction histidine kinase